MEGIEGVVGLDGRKGGRDSFMSGGCAGSCVSISTREKTGESRLGE